MGEFSIYSHRRIEKVSAYPAHRGVRSNISQYPPHTKPSHNAIRLFSAATTCKNQYSEFCLRFDRLSARDCGVSDRYAAF
jgi:hypothetical protein